MLTPSTLYPVKNEQNLYFTLAKFQETIIVAAESFKPIQ